jgi:putative transposase
VTAIVARLTRSKFDNVAKGVGAEVLLILHPNMNAICERLLGSVRRECLDLILLPAENHFRRILREYVTVYFNTSRPHQGLGQRIAKAATNDNATHVGRVVACPIWGKLHHDDQRAA